MNSNSNTRVYKMSFGGVYPLYVQKAEKKGRTKAEVDEIIFWLTGYDQQALQKQIDNQTDFEHFFCPSTTDEPQCIKDHGINLRLSGGRNRRQNSAQSSLLG